MHCHIVTSHSPSWFLRSHFCLPLHSELLVSFHSVPVRHRLSIPAPIKQQLKLSQFIQIPLFMNNDIKQKYINLINYVFDFYQYPTIKETHLRHKVVISAQSTSKTVAITIHHGRLRDNLNSSNSRLYIEQGKYILLEFHSFPPYLFDNAV